MLFFICVLFQLLLDLKNVSSSSRQLRIVPPTSKYFSVGLGRRHCIITLNFNDVYFSCIVSSRFPVECPLPPSSSFPCTCLRLTGNPLKKRP